MCQRTVQGHWIEFVPLVRLVQLECLQEKCVPDIRTVSALVHTLSSIFLLFQYLFIIFFLSFLLSSECASCPLGTYISSSCGGIQNTVCSDCTLCSNLEYESQSCLYGLNTVCNSCESCFFKSPAVRAMCNNDRYRWWALEHCCFDITGTQVSFGGCVKIKERKM